MEYIISAISLLISVAALVVSFLARRDSTRSAAASERSADAAERRVALDEAQHVAQMQEKLQARIVLSEWDNEQGVHVHNGGGGLAQQVVAFFWGGAFADRGGLMRSATVNIPSGSDTWLRPVASARYEELPWYERAGDMPVVGYEDIGVGAAWANDDGTRRETGWVYFERNEERA